MHHPQNRFERRIIKFKKLNRKKKVIMEYRMAEKKTIIQPKSDWKQLMKCDHCGGLMDMISIEEGYSCRNPECLLHIEENSDVRDNLTSYSKLQDWIQGHKNEVFLNHPKIQEEVI